MAAAKAAARALAGSGGTALSEEQQSQLASALADQLTAAAGDSPDKLATTGMSTLSSGVSGFDQTTATAASLLMQTTSTLPPAADDAADDDWLSEQHFQSDDENGPEEYGEPPRTPSVLRSPPTASPRFAAGGEAISPARSLQFSTPKTQSPRSPRSPRTALLDDDDAESGDSTSWVGGNEREVKLTFELEMALFDPPMEDALMRNLEEVRGGRHVRGRDLRGGEGNAGADPKVIFARGSRTGRGLYRRRPRSGGRGCAGRGDRAGLAEARAPVRAIVVEGRQKGPARALVVVAAQSVASAPPARGAPVPRALRSFRKRRA